MAQFIVLVITLAILAAVSAKFHVMMKSIPRKTFVKIAESAPEEMHELVFSVQQKNLVEFDKMLLERSTPGNPLFQKWFTFEEVGQHTSNPEGAKEVKSWLAANGIAATWESAHQDYIKASAPISKWEQLLDTKFYQWEDHSRGKDAKGVKRFMHRAEQYSLPEEVKPHLFAVFNTVQVPPVFKPKYQRLTKSDAEPSFKTSFIVKPSKHGKNLRGKKSPTAADPSVTVQFLNEYYDITSNEGNATMSQSVFETQEESFSPTDLTLFQQTYGLPQQTCEAPYGYSTNDCITYDCYEGNLDVQYMMGVAQNTTTIYWYVTENQATDPFVAWVTDIADTVNPPLVNSMSWGSVEQAQGVDTLGAFNTEAMKLTSMGVTVTVSSGDNGAASDGDYCNYDSSSSTYNTGWTGTPWNGKGYFPSFPATSPYVTAVGATMGPETGDQEVACQSDLGGVITSGGGFSTYNPTPSWQKAAVKSYFQNLLSFMYPTDGYNPKGRAYPDVSLIGVWYEVFVQGELTPLFGTSASAPVFAAFISLANAARAQNGQSALGFINPLIYSYGPSNPYFNDIYYGGNNMCMAYADYSDPSGATCCKSGFYTDAGWDPVTGFGSIQYFNLEAMITNAVYVPTDDDGFADDDFIVHNYADDYIDDDNFATDDHGGYFDDDYDDDDAGETDKSLTAGGFFAMAIGILGGLALIGTAIFIAMGGGGTGAAAAGGAAGAGGTGAGASEGIAMSTANPMAAPAAAP